MGVGLGRFLATCHFERENGASPAFSALRHMGLRLIGYRLGPGLRVDVYATIDGRFSITTNRRNPARMNVFANVRIRLFLQRAADRNKFRDVEERHLRFDVPAGEAVTFASVYAALKGTFRDGEVSAFEDVVVDDEEEVDVGLVNPIEPLDPVS